MIVIGARAIPERRIISITKCTEGEKYFLELVYEGAGGEKLEETISYENLAELDRTFKTAIGDHRAKDVKYKKNLIGDEPSGVTYRESQTSKRDKVRLGNDHIVHKLRNAKNEYLKGDVQPGIFIHEIVTTLKD